MLTSETPLPTFPDFIFHHNRQAREMTWQFNFRIKCSDGKYYFFKINKVLGYTEGTLPEFVANRFWTGFFREAQYNILAPTNPIEGIHRLDPDQTPEEQRLLKS